LWALLLRLLSMLVLLVVLMLVLTLVLVLLLVQHMIWRVLSRMEVFLKVHNNAHTNMFFEELSTRVVSASTPFCPRINFDRAVVAEHIWLLTANRENEIHPSHVVPEVDSCLFRCVRLGMCRKHQLNDGIPQYKNVDTFKAKCLFHLSLQKPKFSNQLLDSFLVHVVVKHGQVNPRSCYIRMLPPVDSFQLLGNGRCTTPEQLRKCPWAMFLLNLV
jgi:hypothetical protein